MNTMANAAKITVHLDGKPYPVVAGTTLAQLLQALQHAPEAVSTAVNGRFVAREKRDQPLRAGDVVLLFQPIVGG